MGNRFTAIAALSAAVVSIAAVMAYAPPLLDFALAVAAAVCWTRWLERHPEDICDSTRTDPARRR